MVARFSYPFKGQIAILTRLLLDHHGHGDHTFPPETGEASDYPLGVLAPQGGASVSPVSPSSRVRSLQSSFYLDMTPLASILFTDM